MSVRVLCLYVCPAQVWIYIKSHGLQSEANKKIIVCDDALRAVFGVDEINMMQVRCACGCGYAMGGWVVVCLCECVDA